MPEASGVARTSLATAFCPTSAGRQRAVSVHEEHSQANESPSRLCLNNPRPLLNQRQKHASRSPRASTALLPVLQSAQRDTDAPGEIRLRQPCPASNCRDIGLGDLDFVHDNAVTVAIEVGASIVKPDPDLLEMPCSLAFPVVVCHLLRDGNQRGSFPGAETRLLVLGEDSRQEHRSRSQWSSRGIPLRSAAERRARSRVPSGRLRRMASSRYAAS